MAYNGVSLSTLDGLLPKSALAGHYTVCIYYQRLYCVCLYSTESKTVVYRAVVSIISIIVKVSLFIYVYML